MAITATIGESKTQEKPFPKLMVLKQGLSDDYKNKGMVVLFTKNNTGTVIANPENYNIGEWQQCWSIELFTDYNEQVTLQNS